MGAFKLFQQSYLSSKLTPVSVRELIFMPFAPCDIWTFQSEMFDIFIKQNEEITKDTIKLLIHNHIFLVFIDYEHLPIFQETQQTNLRQVTRSLSIGDSIKNARKQMSLLSINMGYLFKDPVNDEALDLQFQSSKNLVNFMLSNHKKLPEFYRNFHTQKHHYTLSQPLLSSMLLAAFLQYTKHFSAREIEQLFLASYFKDIGMSLIPTETFDKQRLDVTEKKLMSDHAQHSISILKGRVPLNPSYLNIISNHHGHSLLHGPRLASDHEDDDHMVEGVETLFVAMMDSFVAMISPRPYRDGMSVFEALNVIKQIYAKDHPAEFKILVQFIQKFFGKVFTRDK